MNWPPQPDSDADELAMKRAMILNLVRIAGIIVICLGIAVSEQVLPLPPVLAYVLAASGFLIFFFLPSKLARGWRSNDT